MARLSERLEPSERILFHGRVHPAIWIRPGAVLGIGMFALAGAGGPAAVVAIVVGCIDLCARALQAVRIELLVTDRRVLGRAGLFRARAMTLQDHGGVELLQQGLARYLGFAFVRLTASDGRTMTVRFVGDAPALKKTLTSGAGSAPDRG